MTPFTMESLAAMIDHAALKPELTTDDVQAACRVARRYSVKSVCVRPSDVPRVAEWMGDCSVEVGTVIGFPHGSTSTAAKVAETAQALRDGADELDMVLNIARLIEGDLSYIRDEIAAVVDAADGRTVKVIFECGYLDEARIVIACRATLEGGAHFVKTATGFGPRGATVNDILLMRREVGPDFGVKASGGIRDLTTAATLVDAGANRLGLSATESLMAECPDQ